MMISTRLYWHWAYRVSAPHTGTKKCSVSKQPPTGWLFLFSPRIPPFADTCDEHDLAEKREAEEGDLEGARKGVEDGDEGRVEELVA